MTEYDVPVPAWPFWVAVIVMAALMLVGAVFSITGAKMASPPPTRAAEPVQQKQRVCTAVRLDGTVQGACDRWEWK